MRNALQPTPDYRQVLAARAARAGTPEARPLDRALAALRATPHDPTTGSDAPAADATRVRSAMSRGPATSARVPARKRAPRGSVAAERQEGFCSSYDPEVTRSVQAAAGAAACRPSTDSKCS